MRDLKSLGFSKNCGVAGAFIHPAALAICVLLTAVGVQARMHRSQSWAETQFNRAEGQRETLNGHAEQSRTRREYQTVISSYRRIVLQAPTSSKADASAFAVAELTAEMGRHFKDDMALYSAVREYKFLRKEYPGSKRRIEALLAIGEIYKNDLGDPAEARAALQELLRRYKHSELAKEAQAELASLAIDSAESEKPEPAKGSNAEDQTSPGSAEATAEARTGEAKLTSDNGVQENTVRVTSIEHRSAQDYTRITVNLEQDVQFESQRIDHPDRVFFDLKNARLTSALKGRSFTLDDGRVRKIRVAQYRLAKARIVIETEGRASYNASLVLNPPRLVIDVHNQAVHTEDLAACDSAKDICDQGNYGTRSELIPAAQKSTILTSPASPKKVIVQADEDDPSTETTDFASSDKPDVKSAKATKSLGKSKPRAAMAKSMRESDPTSEGDRSLIRALGLKIGKIVIDPGHGGHDTGTIGPNGLLEKDLVLDVSRRLGRLLEARLGAEVVFTRRDDTFIPLETRTAIANQEQADLFVSVHANSSRDPDARGVETYYLNFTSSPEALEVAARENAASDKSIHELQDLVKKIALKEKIEESREFASDVQASLHHGLAIKNPAERDRGVKKAPFVVLIGANMPSILAEISFVSNPADEKRLKTQDYRQRIAESLYRGISRYVNGLGGVKVASKIEKATAE